MLSQVLLIPCHQLPGIVHVGPVRQGAPVAPKLLHGIKSMRQELRSRRIMLLSPRRVHVRPESVQHFLGPIPLQQDNGSVCWNKGQLAPMLCGGLRTLPS